MAVKFSEFTIETIPENVSYLVGYSGSSNIKIAPGNLLSGVIPYIGALTDVDLGMFGITANQFVKVDGTSSQFLKADGSIDSNTYLTAASGYVPYTGATSDLNLGIHSITATTIVKVGGNSSQFLKADGSTSILPSFSDYVPYIGATTNLNLGTNSITANSIIKAGGNNMQYLMADGTVSTGPSLSGYVPYTGATSDLNLGIHDITANSFIKLGGNSSQFLKADGSVDSNTYITLSGLSATTPLNYSNITGTFSIQQSGVLLSGYLSSSDWNTFYNKQNPITLTTTGNSGAATFIGGTLNIPQYITTTAQSFTGTKTFDDGIAIPSDMNASFGFSSQIYEDSVDGYFNIVSASSVGLSIRSTDSSIELISFGGLSINVDSQNNALGDITFNVGGSLKGIITNSGKFGINNTATSTEIFQVTGDTLLTGTLKVTGSIYTALTTGSVAFINASGLLTQDNANFFWDNTNKRLGIGTATPATFLSIYNANSNAAKTEVMRMEVKNSASAVIDYFKFTLGATTARGGSIIFGETGGGFPEAGMEFNLNHTIIYQGGAYPIYLKTNNVNRLTVTSTGSFLMNQTTDDLVNKVQITGNIKCIGDIILAYTTKSIGATLALSERTIEVTMAITLTLPTATGNTGKEYVIKNNISAGGSVTITGTIDGAASYILSARYKYVHIISNGTSWLIIANN